MEFRQAENRLYRIVLIEDAVDLWWVEPVDGTGLVRNSELASCYGSKGGTRIEIRCP